MEGVVEGECRVGPRLKWQTLHHAIWVSTCGAVCSLRHNSIGAIPCATPGSGIAGYLALSGSLPGAVEALTASPLLLYPAKALIAWPLLYHYGGGVRHLYWDEYKYGIQVDKTSPLELPAVTSSSRTLLYGSIAASVLLAAVSL